MHSSTRHSTSPITAPARRIKASTSPWERDLDRSMAPMELVPQEVTPVFLNLFGNGFYAATKRGREAVESAREVGHYEVRE
jgi:hypothetical protein